MQKKVKIFGFSLLRNGVKYDYSFHESLNSLSPLCEKIYLALGKGEDETEQALKAYPFLHIIPTVWDESLRQGGLILSQQTNLALAELRNQQKNEAAWGIYLQADEVLHEQDYQRIQDDIAKAEEQGCDIVRFRYLHFWQAHSRIAINKKWYPQEIRAVKLNSKVESWGDAQSFRNYNKIYQSDAFIYHYGHVREASAYENKKTGFLKLYASDEKFQHYRQRAEKKDAHTETLAFWGSHPLIMKARIERLGELFSAPLREKIAIVGEKKNYSSQITENILARDVVWASRTCQLKGFAKKEIVIAQPNLWQRWCYQQHVPTQMRSKLARIWSADTQLMLRLSEKAVGLKS